ncbi:class I SAM-dependent methyltransferase [Gilvibacter sediminis]|uniref:class I SAM-dependent methyltransferase n=1 Tax=Gilvibacter sediminis TaxID=379071 RepID=UPI002350FC23|nr:methyltransferase domain-containing protein [Gilvibacter sediminis]MDC7999266.1 methyltransferase domain-containing protein [Gilvibacter sediminis]
MENQFVNISLNKNTLDRYWVRSSIFKAIKSAAPRFKGELLDAGCGQMPYREFLNNNSQITKYVGLDIEAAINYNDAVKPDLTWDGVKMPIADRSYDTVIATEVLEHCPDPMGYLAEVYRVLKPGGVFFFTVPFLWPLHEVPHDAYRYTPFTLERMFKQTGFSEIEIKSLGGYNAALASMIGLWLKRHLRDSWKKRILTRIGLFCMRWLLKRDVAPTQWKESTMSTGFYGILVK